MKIVIIGAGVGGLASARGLLRAGHEVEVYEKAHELRTGGTGLILWSNGSGILQDLGVSLDGVGTELRRVRTGYSDGTDLWQVDLDRIARHFGRPNVVVPRGDVVRRLAEGLPPGTVRLGMTCTGVQDSTDASDPVVVTFADGSRVKADMVVGADGHRSVVRIHLLGTSAPPYTGFASWHGLNEVPIELSGTDTGVTIYGPEGFCVLLPAGDGRLQWVFETPWTDGELVPSPVPGRPAPQGPQADGTLVANLRARFGHWADPVPQVLDALTDADVGLFPHLLLRSPRSWGRGKITLLGDSVHAVPPALAQGVNQVLEDVWTLLRAVGTGGDDAAAICAGYEASCERRLRNLGRYASVMSKGAIPPRILRRAPMPVDRIHRATIRMLSSYLREPRAS